MSVVKIFSSHNVTGTVSYVRGKHDSRAAAMATLGGVDANNFVRVCKGMTKHRSVDAFHVVVAWSPEELDIRNEADISRAMMATQDLLRAAYGDRVKAIVVAHTDADGGHVHTHSVIINAGDDGLALSSWRDSAAVPDAPISRPDGKVTYATTFKKLRRINDEVMKTHGMDICTPAQKRHPDIAKHRPAAYSWVEDIESRIDDAVSQCESYDQFVDALIDVGVTPRVKKNGDVSSYSFTDADNKQRRIRTNKLGTDYDADSIRRRIEKQNTNKNNIEKDGVLMAIDAKGVETYVDDMLRRWKAAHPKPEKKGMPSPPSGGDGMPSKPLSRLEQVAAARDRISRRWAKAKVPASSPASMDDKTTQNIVASAALTYAATCRTFATHAVDAGDVLKAAAWNRAAAYLVDMQTHASAGQLDIDPRMLSGVIDDGHINKSKFGNVLIDMATNYANNTTDEVVASQIRADSTSYDDISSAIDDGLIRGDATLHRDIDIPAQKPSIDLHLPDTSGIRGYENNDYQFGD